MRVMVVDDEDIERKGLKMILERELTNIVVNDEARNGRLAIQIAKTFQPHIIFMDIKMPGMNGLETIEEIRKDSPHVKFVILTAFDTLGVTKKTSTEGVMDYILKPYSKDELIETFDRLVVK
ncbi:YesN/AraC family two-component response regulator [Evansella vedderi]|uniref:YesN/AraC family two-component response regulator n=1 Tax=Evansella vedderi TaxID=38282 RepID=A0ABT9ZQB4_9BACI|nr:response regulator [Evansella vedderi]MDQ0253428.1 YesN/AraC family two-component response regulator [Evansella vedderi]